jgi:hypothetical protein
MRRVPDCRTIRMVIPPAPLRRMRPHRVLRLITEPARGPLSRAGIGAIPIRSETLNRALG